MERIVKAITYRYPEAKISAFNKIANGQIEFDTLLLLLSKMRIDQNRFIFIEKTSQK